MSKETLEEAAENYVKGGQTYCMEKTFVKQGFIEGAKWQSKRMYSEEDMWEAYKASNTIFEDEVALEQEFKEWLEQFKKK